MSVDKAKDEAPGARARSGQRRAEGRRLREAELLLEITRQICAFAYARR